jgi:hypothetical protein
MPTFSNILDLYKKQIFSSYRLQGFQTKAGTFLFVSGLRMDTKFERPKIHLEVLKESGKESLGELRGDANNLFDGGSLWAAYVPGIWRKCK